MYWLIVPLVALLLACMPWNQASPPLPQAQQTPSGQTLLQQRCGNCHGVALVQSRRYSQAEWEGTVARMIKNGVKLTADEQKILVAYLSQTYGPNAPSAYLGADLYQSNCQSCHQSSGLGLASSFPPLANQVPQILKAEEGRKYLIQVVLYGLQGPIEVGGKTYNGQMPSFSSMGNEQLAALLNHISTAWTNQQALPPGFTPFTTEEVRSLRSKTLTPQEVWQRRNFLGLPSQ